MKSLIFLVGVAAFAQQPATEWRQIWADEFDGKAGTPPDPTKWVYDVGGGGWGNRELEVYTREIENVAHDGSGRLIIRAIRSPEGGYTSGRIKTLGKFEVQNGRIAARIRIPFGQGIWPAFWMLGADIGSAGWPRCGEIDIMENIGKEPSTVHATVHGPGYSGGKGIGNKFDLPAGRKFSDDFHVYEVQWEPGKLSFFVDGAQYHQVTPSMLPESSKWVFDHPFFILLNLAVGGAWPGNPDETTEMPQEMLIDWVRVWEKVSPQKGSA